MTEHTAGRPRRRPAQWEISNRQQHEAHARELADGRVSSGAPDEFSNVRGIPQIPHEGGAIMDRALGNVVEGLRPDGRDDQAARCGQSGEAAEAGQAAQ